jgi:uncharacterized protein YceK
MRKILVMLALATILSGCGSMDRSLAKLTGDATKTCVDGVTYLQFTSGAAVQVDRDNKPVPC